MRAAPLVLERHPKEFVKMMDQEVELSEKTF